MHPAQSRVFQIDGRGDFVIVGYPTQIPSREWFCWAKPTTVALNSRKVVEVLLADLPGDLHAAAVRFFASMPPPDRRRCHHAKKNEF